MMDGKATLVSKFAYTFRLRLMAEHLGVKDGDFRFLADPVSDRFYHEIWNQTAESNTVIYRTVFRCLPDDSVHSYDQLSAFSKRMPGELDFVSRAVHVEISGGESLTLKRFHIVIFTGGEEIKHRNKGVKSKMGE
eukprot:TRINITY_DN12373_c0_g1_i1.p1 TRINITY_DN12373_c0_g1~~TRINITY_DN12373_c0_g1_i1.p1  ORF type:complete len:135 (+),score=11.01 TRINITY_DN12373_c0_g1_i1:332-736(+)